MGQTMDQMKLLNQLRKAQKELKNEIAAITFYGSDKLIVWRIFEEEQIYRDMIDFLIVTICHTSVIRALFENFGKSPVAHRAVIRSVEYVFIRKLFLENAFEFLIVLTGHTDVNIIIPGDKTVMPDCAQRGTTDDKQFYAMPVANSLDIFIDFQKKKQQS